MKISMKDYLMVIVILVLIFIGSFLLQQNNYLNEKSIINQKYCLEQYNNPTNYAAAILNCKTY